MDRDKLKAALENGYVEWQRHALERMIEKGISRKAVKEVLINGEIIENYPDDVPYPSALFLGWINNEPLHVVTALDLLTGWCFIITAYKPGLEYFESDYKTREAKMTFKTLPDKCPLCRGTKKKGKTTFTVDLGFGVVVVRDVPATVCSQCGADWIEDAVSEKLEGIVDDARKKHHLVEVTTMG